MDDAAQRKINALEALEKSSAAVLADEPRVAAVELRRALGELSLLGGTLEDLNGAMIEALNPIDRAAVLYLYDAHRHAALKDGDDEEEAGRRGAAAVNAQRLPELPAAAYSAAFLRQQYALTGVFSGEAWKAMLQIVPIVAPRMTAGVPSFEFLAQTALQFYAAHLTNSPPPPAPPAPDPK